VLLTSMNSFGLNGMYWQKGAASHGGGCCLEFAITLDGGHVLIRDSKYRRDARNRPELEHLIMVSINAWDDFRAKVTDGLVVGNDELVVTEHADHRVTLESGLDQTALTYEPEEWAAFVGGVRDNDNFVVVESGTTNS